MTQFDVEEGYFQLFMSELVRAYFKYCILFDVEKVYLLKSPKTRNYMVAVRFLTDVIQCKQGVHYIEM